MARARTLNRSHVLKGLITLSVVSCLAAPQGMDKPRRMLAPLLAPISHGGTYISDTIGRNLSDLLGGECDPQTVNDVLAANPQLSRQLTDALSQRLQVRLVACQQLANEQQQQLNGLTGARQALGADFPCRLVPATVIGGDPTAYGSGRLVRAAGGGRPGDAVTSRQTMTDRPTAVPDTVAALSGSALVGRVTASGAWTAQVQLVSDPDFRTRALVARLVYANRPRTITVEQVTDGKRLLVRRPLAESDAPIPINLVGNGSGLTSAAAPAHHGIEPGDLVVTTGDERQLPMSIMIGTVSAVEPVAGNAKHVHLTIAPAVDLESLRRLYLVLPMATGGR